MGDSALLPGGRVRLRTILSLEMMLKQKCLHDRENEFGDPAVVLEAFQVGEQSINATS